MSEKGNENQCSRLIRNPVTRHGVIREVAVCHSFFFFKKSLTLYHALYRTSNFAHTAVAVSGTRIHFNRIVFSTYFEVRVQL